MHRLVQQLGARLSITLGLYIGLDVVIGVRPPLALVVALLPECHFTYMEMRRAGVPMPFVPLRRRRTVAARVPNIDESARQEPTRETGDTVRQRRRPTGKRPAPRNEAEHITAVLRGEYGVSASVVAAIKTPSFIFYQLRLDRGETIDSVRKSLDDIERRIRDYRRAAGHIEHNRDGMPVPAVVRLDAARAALEVGRHDRRPLAWERRQWEARPHTALAGRYYDADGSYPIVLDLARPDNAHTLVAGTTGSGKSVLVSGLIAGFAESTSPDDLEMVLVDLDSEDFQVFESLPHVRGVAQTYGDAVAAIRYAHAAMGQERNRRIVLGIDELALLITTDSKADGEIFDMIADIAQRGRKHDVHLLTATQKPTADKIGTIAKSNIQVRVCGAVTSPQDSNTVLNVAGQGAEKLPGYGAFIYRCGGSIYRMQAYNMEDPPRVVADIASKWGGAAAPVAPVRAQEAPNTQGMGVYESFSSDAPGLHRGVHHQNGAPAPPLHQSAPQSSAPPAPLFPLDEKRELTAGEAAEVRAMHDAGMSKNALCNEVYGSKSSRYMEWINAALNSDEKIVKLRRSN